MGRRRKTQFDEALGQNNSTYGFYLERLTELSMCMFAWENLPESVDERFLERTLFMNGSAVFFKDEELDNESVVGLNDVQTEEGTYLALPVMLNGNWDVYNVPVKRRAYATNGYQKELDKGNSVVIYNNVIRTNSVMLCRQYARRLWNIDRIIDVNANAQKTPVLVQGTEGQRLTLLNVYQKWDGNEPVIFGTDNLDVNALKVLSTGAPYVADKLYQLKTEIWNEALTYLGISNVNYQKKERMISDEVIRNQGGTIASRYSRLNARREAVEKINQMFGLNIEVNFREDYREADDEVMFPGETGDENMPMGGTQMAIDLRTK